MAGFWRNFFTLLIALCRRGRASAQEPVSARFWVTPFDAGIAVLKSDRYFQLAEAAQLDFLVRTGLIGPLLRQRCSFVNVAQMVRFARPVRVFSRVTVETRIVWRDDKCAWFVHRFDVGGTPHAQVWVKMKFKQGRVTVDPRTLVGGTDGPQPEHLRLWDRTLDAAG